MQSSFVKKFTETVRDFIWDGKKAKISLRNLQTVKQDGGLGLVDIKARDKALKASWVYKLREEHKLLVYSLIENQIGDTIWNCKMQKDDVKKCFTKAPSFWIDVMEAWFEITGTKRNGEEHICPEDVIWYNSSIRIDDKPCFVEKLYKKGLTLVSDLLKENYEFISIEEFCEHFETSNFMWYRSLVSVIKKSKSKIEVQSTDSVTVLERFKTKISVVNSLYRLQTTNPDMTMKVVEKWNHKYELNLNCETFITMIHHISKFTIATKLRSFQYRLLFHALVTNVQLKRYKLTESDACSFCERETETVKHMFIDCNKVQMLWQQIMQNIRIGEINVEKILLNKVCDNPRLVENCIVLLTKHYIYVTCCNKEKLTYEKWKTYVNNYKQIEYHIALRKGKKISHEQKWSDFVC